MSEEQGPDLLERGALVLAIATGDDWLHAGRVDEVLDHARRHRDGLGHPGGPVPAPSGGRSVDLFDAAGHPVRPVVDDRFEVTGFARFGVADEATVSARVERVLGRAQAYLDEHPGGGPAAAWPAMKAVPRPQGDLPDVVAGLRRATTGDPNHHSGGWFHNLLHAMGG